MSIDFAAMGDEELNQLVTDAQAEQTRRSVINNVALQFQDVATQYFEARGVEPGSEWAKPPHPEHGYPRGWEVSRGGKKWRSKKVLNLSEPGASEDWEEVVEAEPSPDPTPEPEPDLNQYPTWVAPSKSQPGYPLGVRAWHKGVLYENSKPDNRLVPGTTNSGWVIYV